MQSGKCRFCVKRFFVPSISRGSPFFFELVMSGVLYLFGKGTFCLRKLSRYFYFGGKTASRCCTPPRTGCSGDNVNTLETLATLYLSHVLLCMGFTHAEEPGDAVLGETGPFRTGMQLENPARKRSHPTVARWLGPAGQSSRGGSELAVGPGGLEVIPEPGLHQEGRCISLLEHVRIALPHAPPGPGRLRAGTIPGLGRSGASPPGHHR